MRVLIHDFAGHPFQIQLSRELAARGHHVTHVYPIGLEGPKGQLERLPTDTERLEIRGIALSAAFRKDSPWRRLVAQRRYARDLKRMISNGDFDVVMSGNTPIDVQAEILWNCKRNHVGFVHWVQDVYCQALKFFLHRKLGALGTVLSLPFFALERMVSSHSDASVVIAQDFADLLTKWGVKPEKIFVIENWAPLNEIQPLARANEWSRKHGLDGKTIFLYSGTLGIKHRPDLLYRLAQSLDRSCSLVVITEGPGRQYLEQMPELENLLLLDFQPYNQIPLVLASADVLVATLEADAGRFAVPSKILSYLCAGRPLLLAAPKTNLAASVVERSEAGFVADPDCPDEWLASASCLARDLNLRESLGANARRYAEREFEISRVATRFEEVLVRVCNSTRSSTMSPLRFGSDSPAPGWKLKRGSAARPGPTASLSKKPDSPAKSFQ